MGPMINGIHFFFLLKERALFSTTVNTGGSNGGEGSFEFLDQFKLSTLWGLEKNNQNTHTHTHRIQ